MFNLDDFLNPKPSRWPQQGDLPFQDAMREEASGPLTDDWKARWVFIMDGFMLAGRTLADQAVNEKFERYDLVYPMLFCYRHAVEIGLKWLIAQYGPRLGVYPSDLNKTHNLCALWQHCVRVFDACGGAGEDKDTLNAVGHIVKQFHDWDKRGMTFRYATTTSGAVVKFPYGRIDIANLKDVMSGVAYPSAEDRGSARFAG